MKRLDPGEDFSLRNVVACSRSAPSSPFLLAAVAFHPWVPITAHYVHKRQTEPGLLRGATPDAGPHRRHAARQQRFGLLHGRSTLVETPRSRRGASRC